MYLVQFIVICVAACLRCCLTQIPVYDIHLEDLMTMQQGLGWPHTLHVSEGHEALLTLGSAIENQQSCSVTAPSGYTFNVASPPTNRYESWSEGCGVRVRNVAEDDEGRWRVTASSTTHSIVGWIELFVEKATINYTAPDISLQDGQTHTDVVLTSLDNSYCVVAQPYSESALVPGHCRVTLDRTTRAVQGNWNVLLGIPGRVQELHLQRQVTVAAERLDVGYVHDTSANKLNLYCNIQHSVKNITFCRFQKTDSVAGYNVIDGLSDGSHSYYGDGFLKRECGMTIEYPTAQDYGTWRCSVGAQMWVGEHIEQQTPMQALISVAHMGTSYFSRHIRVSGMIKSPRDEAQVRTVFVEKDKTFTLMCRANVSLTYCWFQHPNGSQFTPVPIVDVEQPFWYTGESFQTGDCGITLSHATEEEEGEWVCHMGPRDQLGVEITDQVNVRVTGPLAANRKEIETSTGETVTLYCHTANGNRPLDYCRFLTPEFVGLSIDSTVTEDNAILDRFYFTPERHLQSGDCSLTINSVHAEDFGQWTCAALINDDAMESMDSIIIYNDDDNESPTSPRSRADIIGMSVGLSVLVVALAGFLIYKKRGIFRRLPAPSPSQTNSPSDIVTFERRARNRPSDCSNEGTSSVSSNEVTIIDRPNSR